MTELVRAEDLRVSHIDRTAAQQVLTRAHDDGHLDLHEFDARLRVAMVARTRGDLARLTADLPARPSSAVRRRVFSDGMSGSVMRVLTLIWSVVMTINLVAWVLHSMTSGMSGPSFLGLLIPGSALFVLYVAGIGRPSR